MEGYLDFRNRPREYVEARIEEARAAAKLAEEMLKKELYQNAANKAFMALKALLSALVVLRLDLLTRDAKRREWYLKVGYAAPTTGLIRIAKDLEALGVAGVEPVVKTALMLHRFAYNGFDPNFVDYSDLEEVASDVKQVLEYVEKILRQLETSKGN